MDPTDSDSSDAAVPYPSRFSREERQILSAIGDPVALAILSALDGGERDGHSLVLETRLPQSSIYRKLRELEEERLVYVSRLAFTRDGHKVELFRSRLKEIHLEFTRDQPRVRVVVHEDAADRIHGMWTEVRRSSR
ncbi:MAG: ArsR family transcriptional regulator [Thermoplasmata archaeon]